MNLPWILIYFFVAFGCCGKEVVLYTNAFVLSSIPTTPRTNRHENEQRHQQQQQQQQQSVMKSKSTTIVYLQSLHGDDQVNDVIKTDSIIPCDGIDLQRRLYMKQTATTTTASAATAGLFFLTSSSSLSWFGMPTNVLADTGAEVRGTPVTPFNALMFNYRGTDYPGLQSDELNEPSIPYTTFIERMKKGEVEFVEFIAPNGDAAYVTFKGDNNNPPIRIGDGYPIEQPDGYSSPAFAIRAVKNAGVPYKFTVPALSSSGKRNKS